MRTAAIVTVGTELTEGLRLDTNTAYVARQLAGRGFRVVEALSVSDDVEVLSEALHRLVESNDLVVTTGGLGPTHDDVTRDAAARALGLELVSDERLRALLEPIRHRHADPVARDRVLAQSLVLPGAEVIDFTTGTAPGLVVDVADGATLALLPGPPAEMRPMLAALLGRYASLAAEPRQLGAVGLSESDAQVHVERAIQDLSGVGFTILASPGDVRVILVDDGAGDAGLDVALQRAAEALGEHCYATDDSTLAEVVIEQASAKGITIALAESCTGGLVAAALTDVPGASQVFKGSVVSYADQAKVDLLGVRGETVLAHGAVSAQTVAEMAEGARAAFAGVDVAVAVSGIAGPRGGTPDKPVGTVWFGVATSEAWATERGSKTAPRVLCRRLGSTSRAAVRARATATALDLLRRATGGLPIPES